MNGGGEVFSFKAFIVHTMILVLSLAFFHFLFLFGERELYRWSFGADILG